MSDEEFKKELIGMFKSKELQLDKHHGQTPKEEHEILLEFLVKVLLTENELSDDIKEAIKIVSSGCSKIEWKTKSSPGQVLIRPLWKNMLRLLNERDEEFRVPNYLIKGDE